jgi:hypothetical protein
MVPGFRFRYLSLRLYREIYVYDDLGRICDQHPLIYKEHACMRHRVEEQERINESTSVTYQC